MTTERGLSVQSGDFSLRWHLICAASVAGALIIAYKVAKTLIFS